MSQLDANACRAPGLTMSRLPTTAANRTAADVICARLHLAGIGAVADPVQPIWARTISTWKTEISTEPVNSLRKHERA